MIFGEVNRSFEFGAILFHPIKMQIGKIEFFNEPSLLKWQTL